MDSQNKQIQSNKQPMPGKTGPNKFITPILISIFMSGLGGVISFMWGGVFNGAIELLFSEKGNAYAFTRVYSRAWMNERGLGAKRTDFDITIIAVHEHNLEPDGRFNRKRLAELINDIARLEPAVIGVDYILDRPTSTDSNSQHQEDQELLKTLERYRDKIVLPLPLTVSASGYLPLKSNFFDIVRTKVDFFGHVNVNHRPGEEPPVWRKTTLAVPDDYAFADQEKQYPSFALLLYLKKKYGKELTFNLVEHRKRLRQFLSKQNDIDLEKRLNDPIQIDFRRLNRGKLTQIKSYDDIKEDLGAMGRRPYHNSFQPTDLTPTERNVLSANDILKIDEADEEAGNYVFDRSVLNRNALIEKLKEINFKKPGIVIRYWKDSFPKFIRNRIIIIGPHYHKRDLHYTPINKFKNRREHGMYMHARIVDMLLKGTYIRESSLALNMLIITSNLFLILMYTLWRQGRYAPYIFILHLLIYTLFNWTLFVFFRIYFILPGFLAWAVIFFGLLFAWNYHRHKKEERPQPIQAPVSHDLVELPKRKETVFFLGFLFACFAFLLAFLSKRK